MQNWWRREQKGKTLAAAVVVAPERAAQREVGDALSNREMDKKGGMRTKIDEKLKTNGASQKRQSSNACRNIYEPKINTGVPIINNFQPYF